MILAFWMNWRHIMACQIELADLRPVWGRVQSQQQLMVAMGLRPACRLRINRARLPVMADTVERLSIKMLVGHDSVVPHEANNRASFSEWSHRETLSPRSLGDCYVYLCSDYVYGQRLRRCDEAGDESAVGKLLGYPDCCVKAFNERGLTGDDPVVAMYDDSSPIDWRLNVSLLRFDLTLLNHVACRADCSSSRALATQYHELLETVEPDEAAKLRQVLSGWVFHSEALGVAAFTAVEGVAGLEVQTLAASDEDSFLGQLITPGAIIKREGEGILLAGYFFAASGVRLFQFI
jgi:hypothetical protein